MSPTVTQQTQAAELEKSAGAQAVSAHAADNILKAPGHTTAANAIGRFISLFQGVQGRGQSGTAVTSPTVSLAPPSKSSTASEGHELARIWYTCADTTYHSHHACL